MPSTNGLSRSRRVGVSSLWQQGARPLGAGARKRHRTSSSSSASSAPARPKMLRAWPPGRQSTTPRTRARRSSPTRRRRSRARRTRRSRASAKTTTTCGRRRLQSRALLGPGSRSPARSVGRPARCQRPASSCLATSRACPSLRSTRAPCSLLGAARASARLRARTKRCRLASCMSATSSRSAWAMCGPVLTAKPCRCSSCRPSTACCA